MGKNQLYELMIMYNKSMSPDVEEMSSMIDRFRILDAAAITSKVLKEPDIEQHTQYIRPVISDMDSDDVVETVIDFMDYFYSGLLAEINRDDKCAQLFIDVVTNLSEAIKNGTVSGN